MICYNIKNRGDLMNYITVEDVLQLDVAREWKVAAGEGGLSNTVSWFYVCQENEISPWVEGREIMILYGSGIKTDTPDLVRIVDICAQKQLSAVIVLLGHYIHSLPPEMLGEADAKNVPIIIMPVTQPIVHVTKALAELLMGVHERMRQCGELLKDMIFGFDSDISKLLFAMEQAGFEAGKAYRFVVFDFPARPGLTKALCSIRRVLALTLRRCSFIRIISPRW